MKKLSTSFSVLILLLLPILLTGCQAIGDIFSAGVYAGIFIVVFIVIIVIVIISKLGKKG